MIGPMLVLGIHDGKDPSVALVRDGALVRMAFESQWADDPTEATGFPERATAHLLAVEGVRGKEIDVIAFSGNHLPDPTTRRQLLKRFHQAGTFKGFSKRLLKSAVPFGGRGPSRRDRLKPLEALGLAADRSVFIDHHLAQAAMASASQTTKDGKLLVMCCEGSGDGIAGSVHVSRAGVLDRVATVADDHSLGFFLETITYLLGMVPNRDESLVMELGGLAQGGQIENVTKRLSILFEMDPSLPLNWRRAGNMPETHDSVDFLRSHLRRRRFDHIAGAARRFMEQFLAQWMVNGALKTQTRHASLTGRVFGLGPLYPALSKVESLETISLSAITSDAGNAAGAAFVALDQSKGNEHRLPLGHIWLGQDIDESACAQFARDEEERPDSDVERPEEVEERVAELLAQGMVLGRFSGRLDIGRFGMGNRSLLCRGDHPQIRLRVANLVRDDVFWNEVPALALRSELPDLFLDVDKLADRVCGEYWLHPKRPFGWAGRRNPSAPVPVQILDEDADPVTTALVKAFRKIAGDAPLLAAPWQAEKGRLVRDADDVRERWRSQGLDGVVAGSYLVLRREFEPTPDIPVSNVVHRPWHFDD